MKLFKSLLAVGVAMTVSATVFAEEGVMTEVKQDVKSAWQTVKSDAKTVGGKVKDGAVKVKDATKEKFVEAKDATKEKFAEGKKAVKDKFQNEKPAPVEDKSTIKGMKETKEKSAVENKAKITRSQKVDINNADAATLERLSGIGETKAKAIIEYREKNGKIKNLEELSKVPGIGDSTLEKIKSHVRFN